MNGDIAEGAWGHTGRDWIMLLQAKELYLFPANQRMGAMYGIG